MPTDADELHAAYGHVTSAPVDPEALLRSVETTVRRRRRARVAGVVGIGAAAVLAIASLNGKPDRITTIPANTAEIPFCEAREPVVRRDYARVVELVQFALYLPDPVPSGACLSNVESDILWNDAPAGHPVNLWFDWDGAQIYLRELPPGSPDAEGFSEQVLIGGETWGRRETSNAVVSGSNGRGGIVYLSRRFGDGVVVTVSTTTAHEGRARHFAELLARSADDQPSDDARAAEARAACDAVAGRYNEADARVEARPADARATTAGSLTRWLEGKGRLTSQWSDAPPDQPLTVCLLDGDFSRLPLSRPDGAPGAYAHLIVVVSGDDERMLSAGQPGTLNLDGLE